MAELQTGKKLRRARVDGGGEFDNDLWHAYAKEHGIILEFTTPYSSAQNGVAERKFGVILDGTRVTLIESGLSKDMWCEAASTHTYIRGLLPSGRHPDRIPAEVWSGKRQDISHLRPFGCIAYAHVPKEHGGSKLDARSVKCILIGYHGRRSYRLWDPVEQKLVISRDVIFEEGVGHRTLPAEGADITIFDEDSMADRVQLEEDAPPITDDAPSISDDPLIPDDTLVGFPTDKISIAQPPDDLTIPTPLTSKALPPPPPPLITPITPSSIPIPIAQPEACRCSSRTTVCITTFRPLGGPRRRILSHLSHLALFFYKPSESTPFQTSFQSI